MRGVCGVDEDGKKEEEEVRSRGRGMELLAGWTTSNECPGPVKGGDVPESEGICLRNTTDACATTTSTGRCVSDYYSMLLAACFLRISISLSYRSSSSRTISHGTAPTRLSTPLPLIPSSSFLPVPPCSRSITSLIPSTAPSPSCPHQAEAARTREWGVPCDAKQDQPASQLV